MSDCVTWYFLTCASVPRMAEAFACAVEQMLFEESCARESRGDDEC